MPAVGSAQHQEEDAGRDNGERQDGQHVGTDVSGTLTSLLRVAIPGIDELTRRMRRVLYYSAGLGLRGAVIGGLLKLPANKHRAQPLQGFAPAPFIFATCHEGSPFDRRSGRGSSSPPADDRFVPDQVAMVSGECIVTPSSSAVDENLDASRRANGPRPDMNQAAILNHRAKARPGLRLRPTTLRKEL